MNLNLNFIINDLFILNSYCLLQFLKLREQSVSDSNLAKKLETVVQVYQDDLLEKKQFMTQVLKGAEKLACENDLLTKKLREKDEELRDSLLQIEGLNEERNTLEKSNQAKDLETSVSELKHKNELLHKENSIILEDIKRIQRFAIKEVNILLFSEKSSLECRLEQLTNDHTEINLAFSRLQDTSTSEVLCLKSDLLGYQNKVISLERYMFSVRFRLLNSVN